MRKLISCHKFLNRFCFSQEVLFAPEVFWVFRLKRYIITIDNVLDTGASHVVFVELPKTWAIPALLKESGHLRIQFKINFLDSNFLFLICCTRYKFRTPQAVLVKELYLIKAFHIFVKLVFVHLGLSFTLNYLSGIMKILRRGFQHTILWKLVLSVKCCTPTGWRSIPFHDSDVKFGLWWLLDKLIGKANLFNKFEVTSTTSQKIVNRFSLGSCSLLQSSCNLGFLFRKLQRFHQFLLTLFQSLGNLLIDPRKNRWIF